MTNSLKKSIEATFLSLGIPLADYGITNKDGTILSGSFRNKSFVPIPSNSESIFRMASMTKVITAFLTLSVLKEKKISLDDPVDGYLPEPINSKIVSLKDGLISYTESQTPITFHQLLNCTSGHGYEHHHEEISTLIREKEISPMKDADNEFLKAPLISAPGKSWNYGISYGWLGVAIEQITKTSLNEILKKYMVQPLNLKNTTFEYNEVDVSKLSPIFFRDSSSNYSDITDKINLGKGPSIYAGGGLFSNLEDYLKILRFLLPNTSGKHHTSNKKLIEKMFLNQIGDLGISSLKSFNTSLVLENKLYPKIKRKKWGYGMMLNADRLEGGRAEGSGNWAGVFNTYFWVDRKTGLAGTILMQTLPCYDSASLRAFEKFETLCYKYYS